MSDRLLSPCFICGLAFASLKNVNVDGSFSSPRGNRCSWHTVVRIWKSACSFRRVYPDVILELMLSKEEGRYDDGAGWTQRRSAGKFASSTVSLIAGSLALQFLAGPLPGHCPPSFRQNCHHLFVNVPLQIVLLAREDDLGPYINSRYAILSLNAATINSDELTAPRQRFSYLYPRESTGALSAFLPPFSRLTTTSPAPEPR
ncbi:hypothetical protein BDV98DRAFT_205640 [Pterulicium gracile]|uniref:Uncharacterized protein n=1 Tax=Pterulicium gracile TaxID=1884261 RepID=A0A5C3QJH5_9AGAR|nr:hypothetical protein BDV98DRAFT_205640 [Pterula gracilis]